MSELRELRITDTVMVPVRKSAQCDNCYSGNLEHNPPPFSDTLWWSNPNPTFWHVCENCHIGQFLDEIFPRIEHIEKSDI